MIQTIHEGSKLLYNYKFSEGRQPTPDESQAASFRAAMSEAASPQETPNIQQTLSVNFGGRVNVFLHEVQETPPASSNVLPEGLQLVNAYGLTIKSHNAPTGEPNHFGTIDDYRHELIPLYDTNSPEDNPVMYVIDHDQLNDTDEVHRIEVNKINPLTATYEEMVALVGYTYRDDPEMAMGASNALFHARDYIEHEGIDPDGPKDYVGWLMEVVRRNIDYPNPSNQKIGRAAESLLEYLKDYPRVNDKA